MQETQVQSLVPEVARDTGEQVNWAPRLLSLCSGAWELQLLIPRATTSEALEPVLCNKKIHRSEKPARHYLRVAPAHGN